MLLTVTATVFTAFFIITLTLLQRLDTANQKNLQRLDEVLGSTPPATVRERELKAPFYQRIIMPLLGKLGRKMVNMLPAEKEAALISRINHANLQKKIGPKEFLVLKYLSCGIVAILGGLIGSNFNQQVTGLLSSGTVGLLLGWYGPDLYLLVKGRERQRQIEKNLPDILDLLTVSVEAGLGFDGALMKVVEESKGPLPEEFALVLQEIKMGKPRAEALRDLANRTGVDELASFTSAIILADQLGISIGNVLRLHAEQIRLKRRQKAEELAMKAPVKMLFPLIFFIFPALFIVLLGPAVLQISNYFLK